MGSASREALGQARASLDGGLDKNTGAELLRAATQLVNTPSIAVAIHDTAATSEGKAALVERVFGQFSGDARRVLVAAATARWSSADEFVAGVEELGIRAESLSNSALSDELLAVASLVDDNHDLQLSLGSKLIDSEGKVSLVRQLLVGKTSASAVAVVSHLVSNPRGRRLDATLRSSARVAADQVGSELATVTVAAPLSLTQQQRLARVLEQTAGRAVQVKTVVDPEIIGGIRIQIADDIIDGSVRARLDDLRQQLVA
jgi:F-type H+-transporting ATPase subunit delta